MPSKFYRIIIFTFILFSDSFLINAQEIEENPERPNPESAWQVVCDFKNRIATDPSSKCRISQSIIVTETNTPVLEVKVFNDPSPLLLASYPLNIYLKTGINIKVDNNISQNHDFEICNEQGCHSGIKLSQETLNSFKGGNIAVFTVTDATGKEIKLPISLKGFTASWNEMTSLKAK